MPKRVIDADAVFNSDKVARCRPEHKAEYTWLYGLADANGNFEMTNVRSLHSKAYAPIRPEVSVDFLKSVLVDFERNGLLYTWFENGKRYGHWTGCEKPGRLPPKNHRQRYAGTLQVHSLYQAHSDEVADPGLTKYLDETKNPQPDPQLTLDSHFPTTQEIHTEAEGRVDTAQKKAMEADTQTSEYFRQYMELYPPAGWVRPDDTRKAFYSRKEIAPAIIAGLIRYLNSKSWKDGFVDNSDKFIINKVFEKPPRETNNGQRTLGPAGRTTEDYIARNKKIDDIVNGVQKRNS